MALAMPTPGGMPPNGFRAENGLKVDVGLTGINVNHDARAELIGACLGTNQTSTPPVCGRGEGGLSLQFCIVCTYGGCACCWANMSNNHPAALPPRTGTAPLTLFCICCVRCAGLNAELMAQAAALPATAVYRTSVESTCSHTLSVLESGVTDAEAEATLGLGQLEEQLLAAKDELNLMVMMGSWKPWEGASRTLKTSLACRLRVPTSTW
jgi:hypothetical protein